MATTVALTMRARRPKPRDPPPSDEPAAGGGGLLLPDEPAVRQVREDRAAHDEVLDKSFSAQLKDRKIVWQVVNFEEPENTHLPRSTT